MPQESVRPSRLLNQTIPDGEPGKKQGRNQQDDLLQYRKKTMPVNFQRTATPSEGITIRTRATSSLCAIATNEQNGDGTTICADAATSVLTNAAGDASNAVPADDARDANAITHANASDASSTNTTDAAHAGINDAAATNG